MESIVRTLIFLTLVSWIACPAAIRACCGSYHEIREDDGIVAFLTSRPTPVEESVFRSGWMLTGVEELTAICATGGENCPPEREAAVDLRDQFYADMWTTPPGDGQPIVVEGCCYSYSLSPSVIRQPNIPPSTIPAFDAAWLIDAVWPRTRMFLVGAEVKRDARRYELSEECL